MRKAEPFGGFIQPIHLCFNGGLDSDFLDCLMSIAGISR